MTHTRHNAGFSLLEVMVAILILGVALVGLTQGLSTALSSTKESELQTTASLLAAAQIEGLRADGYITDGETEGACGEELPLYRWKQSVKTAPIAGLHEVQVTIQNAKTGKDIYELKTMLFDPPPEADDAASKKKDKKPKSRQRSRE